MAIGDGIFVVGRRSKQFLWLTLVFRSGVRFYIWATVIFRFAITGFEKGFEKRGQENHKITRNLGFHFELMTEFYPTQSWVTKQQYENSLIT
jgi:hypothetical protein